MHPVTINQTEILFCLTAIQYHVQGPAVAASVISNTFVYS